MEKNSRDKVQAWNSRRQEGGLVSGGLILGSVFSWKSLKLLNLKLAENRQFNSSLHPIVPGNWELLCQMCSATHGGLCPGEVSVLERSQSGEVSVLGRSLYGGDLCTGEISVLEWPFPPPPSSPTPQGPSQWPPVWIKAHFLCVRISPAVPQRKWDPPGSHGRERPPFPAGLLRASHTLLCSGQRVSDTSRGWRWEQEECLALGWPTPPGGVTGTRASGLRARTPERETRRAEAEHLPHWCFSPNLTLIHQRARQRQAPPTSQATFRV